MQNGKNVNWRLWLLLIVLLGVVLRLVDLGTESYWQDEITMTRLMESGVDEIVLQTQQGRPPFYVVLAYGWSQLFGTGEVEMRLLSVVLSTLAIGAVFVLGRELVADERFALMAAFLMAISGRQIWHAQDVRYYALQVLVAALAYLFLVRALRRGGWFNWITYVLFAIGVFYAHTHGIFTLLAMGVFGLLQWFVYKEQRLQWIASQVVIIILILPQLLPILVNAAPGIFGGLSFLIATDITVVEGLSLGNDWLDAPDMIELPLIAWRMLFYGFSLSAFAAAGVFFVVAQAIVIQRRGFAAWRDELRQWPGNTWAFVRNHYTAISLMLTLFVIVWAVPFFGSFILVPMFTLRYVIVASIGLFLILALLAYLVRQLIPMWLVAVTLLIAALPTLYLNYYQEATKQQWREVAAFVAEEAEPDDVIVMPSWNRSLATVDEAFLWYYDQENTLCALRLTQDELYTDEIREGFDTCVDDAETLWLVLFDGSGFLTDLDATSDFLTDAGYTAVGDVTQFVEVLALRFERDASAND